MVEVTGNDFIDKLLEQAPPVATQPVRGQNYNFPYRYYLKPDGSVVQLQGDPQNRAYYADLGYHMLSQSPSRATGLSEEEQYVQVEYPKILKQQRAKAELINAIRKAAERNPTMALEDTFDDYSVEEIREYLKQVKEETGKDVRIVKPKRVAAREEAEEARLLAGVETSESMSIEGLQSKLIQGTGYDPIDQARRTRRGNGGAA